VTINEAMADRVKNSNLAGKDDSFIGCSIYESGNSQSLDSYIGELFTIGSSPYYLCTSKRPIKDLEGIGIENY
jgi:hypothetical protein